MALVVGLDMGMVVIGDHKVVVVGLVLGIASCWDPHNMMYLEHVRNLFKEFLMNPKDCFRLMQI